MAMPTCGLRESGGVVDAVARHGDDPPLGLEALHDLHLAGRQHLGLEGVQAQLRATAAAVVRLSPVAITTRTPSSWS